MLLFSNRQWGEMLHEYHTLVSEFSPPPRVTAIAIDYVLVNTYLA